MVLQKVTLNGGKVGEKSTLKKMCIYRIYFPVTRISGFAGFFIL